MTAAQDMLLPLPHIPQAQVDIAEPRIKRLVFSFGCTANVTSWLSLVCNLIANSSDHAAPCSLLKLLKDLRDSDRCLGSHWFVDL